MIENSVLAYVHGSDRERNGRICQRDLTARKRTLRGKKSETRVVHMGYLSSGSQDDWILAKYLFFFIVFPPRSINSKKKGV